MVEDLERMDCKAETQIAVVEVIIEGKVIYTKSIFVDDVDGLIDGLEWSIQDYDQAK